MSIRHPMPKPTRLLVTLGLTIACVVGSARPAGTNGGGSPPTATLAAAGLDSEKREGEKLGSKITAYLGPLASVALSPFFGLTCLSGASLLADSGLPFTSGIKSNPLLGERSPLHNPAVFAGLLALTLLTAAPKLTKVTKPLAQAVDQIEAYSGIIAVVAVQFLSKLDLGETAATPEAATILVQAGIFSFGVDVLIAIASAINIIVVNTVKFFFEVLIWLSPVPTVDAIFEAANKAVVAFLVGLYVASPFWATALNLLIFLVCLVIFAWVRRRVSYMRGVLGDPVLGWIGERIFRRPRATMTSTPLPSSVSREFNNCTMILKAFVGNGLPKIKRKTRGFLLRTIDGRLVFVRARWFRSPRVTPLPEPGDTATVETGLLSNTINLPGAGGGGPVTLILTRRYNALLEHIRQQLGAASVEAPSTASHRSPGQAAKDDIARGELRAELA